MDALLSEFETSQSECIQRYHCALPGDSERALDRVCQNIRDSLRRTVMGPIQSDLPRMLSDCLANLRKDESDVVSKADKGDAKVVMDTTHYTQLAWTHLSDENTYHLLESNPTPTLFQHLSTYNTASRTK